MPLKFIHRAKTKMLFGKIITLVRKKSQWELLFYFTSNEVNALIFPTPEQKKTKPDNNSNNNETDLVTPSTKITLIDKKKTTTTLTSLQKAIMHLMVFISCNIKNDKKNSKTNLLVGRHHALDGVGGLDEKVASGGKRSGALANPAIRVVIHKSACRKKNKVCDILTNVESCMHL